MILVVYFSMSSPPNLLYQLHYMHNTNYFITLQSESTKQDNDEANKRQIGAWEQDCCRALCISLVKAFKAVGNHVTRIISTAG